MVKIMAVEIGAAGPVLLLFTYTFVFHIVLVNIDIGLALIIPFLKRYGEKTQNRLLLALSRRYMRYLAIIYASAGVFATAFTVFLLSFYPPVISLISRLLFWPYTLALIFLGIRLFSISAYWYGWDRFSSEKHFYLGLVLASTSFLVPFSLRLPMAFFNTPTGLVSENPPQIDVVLQFLLNPTFWPFYLKSVFGALVATSFMLLTVHGYYYCQKTEYAEDMTKLLKKYFSIGSASFIIAILAGIWYFFALSITSSFKFNNIVGSLIGKEPQGINMAIPFLFKLVVLVTQGTIIGIFLWKFYWKKENFELENSLIRKSLMVLGPLALITIIVGEIINGYSQFPYLISDPALVSVFPAIDTNQVLNPIAAAFDVYVITIFALVPLFLAFLVLLYYLISGKVIDQPS